MIQPEIPYALRLADECEESAKVWANETDTRERAAAELRRLSAEVELLKAGIKAEAPQDPIAWIRARDIGRPQLTCISTLIYRSAQEEIDGTRYIPVYVSPMSPHAFEDWRLVPKEPTSEMCTQGELTGKKFPQWPWHAEYVYKAMLAAAPQEQPK